MLKRQFHNFAVLALTLSVTPFILGCGSDEEGNGGTGPEVSDFVGDWNATSFVVDKTDLVADGTSIIFSFTATTYSFVIANDANGVLCDSGPTSCGESGDLSSTETTFTFDPGTNDEVTFSYNVTGDTMTVSGAVDGTAISATFQKI
jgi:hypothetical protein